MSSLDRILPFLRPIEDLLCDATVTEVMVNDGGRHVFVERDGTIEAVADRTLETRNLSVAIKNIARACGDEISEAQPLLDARLEDGSRVAAIAAARDRLSLLPTREGETVELLPGSVKNYRRVQWMPDGREVLFSAEDGGGSVPRSR